MLLRPLRLSSTSDSSEHLLALFIYQCKTFVDSCDVRPTFARPPRRIEYVNFEYLIRNFSTRMFASANISAVFSRMLFCWFLVHSLGVIWHCVNLLRLNTAFISFVLLMFFNFLQTLVVNLGRRMRLTLFILAWNKKRLNVRVTQTIDVIAESFFSVSEVCGGFGKVLRCVCSSLNTFLTSLWSR